MLAIEQLRPEAAVLTPSYAAYLVEWAAERSFDLRASSVRRVLVAGEPGGGEPAFRAQLEEGWGARVTEAMGIGDIGPSLWGECEHQDGMHLGARGFVHAELIDPETGAALALEDGASGELVLTHLRHRAAPLLRFRTRDHVVVRTEPLPLRSHRPARALHRPHRRHADRARRQRLPVGDPRGRERVRAARERHDPRQAAVPGRSRIRRCRWRSSSRRAARAIRRSPTRSASACAQRSSSRCASSSCRGAACSAASTSRSSYNTRREVIAPMRKLQSQGVHHITITGAGPADVDRLLGGRARHALRVRAAEPRQRVREPSLLRSGRRAPDHGVHERGAEGRPAPHAHRARLRAPPGVLALPGDVQAGRGAARRARHQAQRRDGPRLHGLDLLQRSPRPADRARVLPLRAAVRLHALRRPARSAQAADRSAATTTSPRSTSPTRSRRWSRARGRRSRTTARPKNPY